MTHSGRCSFTRVLCLLTICLPSALCRAWDGAGHRMITRVALHGLSDDMPAWLKDAQTLLASPDLSQQPDRWRSVRTPQLRHVNEPDHYLDVEDLEPLGMTLRTMPVLRHEYVRAVHEGRSRPDFDGPPVKPAADPVKTQEYPGFLAHATLENYGRLVGAFRMVRMLETMKEPARAGQIEAARWNARVQIGILSHFVGDTSQPLHTTRHHHGWIGDNPNGYTTDRNIHRYIDGEILRLHTIRDDDVHAHADFERRLTPDDLWGETLTYIERSFSRVEPLYKMEKSGALKAPEGKAFICERLGDSASQLSALIEAAWAEAAPTPKDISDLRNFEGEKAPSPGSTD